MKTIILITSLLCLFACDESEQKSRPLGKYSVIELEGCEYLEYDYGLFDQRVYSLTHKGNCKNHH
jgi:hypothetical protein